MSNDPIYRKKYRQANREKINTYMSEYQKQYYLNKPEYRQRQIRQKKAKYQFQKEAKRLMSIDLF